MRHVAETTSLRVELASGAVTEEFFDYVLKEAPKVGASP